MARPIEPTPPLDVEDSERLLSELEHVCSPEEAKRRVRMAEKRLTEVLTPNGEPGADAPAG